ncbi:TPA: hypothetical protein PSL13_002839 [Staphylococcus aureus]|nr:hypothetical protein [Staphylococcus aureus]
MIVEELLNKLNSKDYNLRKISKELPGVGEGNIRQALKKAGYVYHPKKVAWINTTEDALANLNKPIFEFMVNSPRRGRSNSKVIKDSANSNTTSEQHLASSNTSVIFTDDELIALQGLARELVAEEEYQDARMILHKRIQELSKATRGRKTFAIKPELEKQINDMAAKTKFHQADLLEIALLDFFKRYEV